MLFLIKFCPNNTKKTLLPIDKTNQDINKFIRISQCYLKYNARII